ncbi:MAG: hypothetical protein K2X61_14955 [Caulobacteraceae bacterium]|nr:hypothetical protein [Caulobacteraceae bacterium]
MFNVSGDAAERLRYLLGGVAGALIYGVFTFMQLIKLGHRPSLGDYGRAVLNVTAAMIVAAIAAPTLGPSLVSLIPWEGLRNAADPIGVGVVVGAVGWELLPVLIEAARRLINGVGAAK